ncbi:hypothetical protein ElyMa_001512500 [Elysia marginata]|uniref:Uncharacterized protein n=1 Tax=Elysia marginata TaxID=1093978 RepID=A0AAV4J5Y2_9GAST|nr:hypothetical protein ElyMa_001512500 [Elysia marginata]
MRITFYHRDNNVNGCEGLNETIRSNRTASLTPLTFKYNIAAWRSGQRVGLEIWRSRVRFPTMPCCNCLGKAIYLNFPQSTHLYSEYPATGFKCTGLLGH